MYATIHSFAPFSCKGCSSRGTIGPTTGSEIRYMDGILTHKRQSQAVQYSYSVARNHSCNPIENAYIYLLLIWKDNMRIVCKDARYL